MLKTVYKLFLTTFFVTLFSVFSFTIASENTALTPDRFQLGQNYPNPFNPSTKFDYSVPTTSKVVIKVYNILGQEVRTLVNGQVFRVSIVFLLISGVMMMIGALVAIPDR